MANVETNINIGSKRYAPTVNYSLTPMAPVKPVEDIVKRPSIDLTDTIVGLTQDMAKGYAKKKEQQELDKYNQGLNDYAKALSDIVEGQRQGEYNPAKAERLIRTETNSRLANGWSADDLAKIRDKYDGGIAANEEARQKLIMEHEQNRQLKRIEEARKNYPQWERLDDDSVALKLARRDSTFETLDQMNRTLGQMHPSSEGYKKFNEAKKTLMKEEAAAEMVEYLGKLYTDKAAAGEITADTISQIKRTMASAFAPRFQGNMGDLMAAIDGAMNETGISTLYDVATRDLTEGTEFKKRVIDYMDSDIQVALRSTKEGAVVMNLPPEIRANLKQHHNDLYQRFSDQVFKTETKMDSAGRQYVSGINIMGQHIDADARDEIKFGHAVINANLRDMSYPPALFARQVGVASNTSTNYIVSQNPETDTDRDTLVGDIDKLLDTYKNPAVDAKLAKAKSKNVDDALSSVQDNVAVLKGTKEGLLLGRSNTDSKRIFNSIQNSLQADRLRIDPKTGEFVMLEDTKGFLQNAGDLIASEGTRRDLNKLNEFLKDMEPLERLAAARALSDKKVSLLEPGRSVWDTSQPTLKETITGGISDMATSAYQSIEGLQRKVGKGVTENNKETSTEIEKLQKTLENEDLKPHIRRAVEGTIEILKNQDGTATATMKSSTPLVNAHMETPENYEGSLPENMIDELSYMRTKEYKEKVAKKVKEVELKEEIAHIKKVLKQMKSMNNYEERLTKSEIENLLKQRQADLHTLTHEELPIDQE